MVQRFKVAGHPVFKSMSALSRGVRRRIKGRETIHFNADAWNTKFFRIIHSANQLSIYGAVSNWCEEFGLAAHDKEDTSDKSASKENE